MDFVDADGNIIVPKAVRPAIGLQETALGSKKGARRQYRYGTLHIRDYDSHYTVHVDRVDPRSNPIGHLIADAPEYLAATAAATLASRYVGRKVYRKCKGEGRSTGEALAQAAAAGLVTGLAAGKWAYDAANSIRKKRR